MKLEELGNLYRRGSYKSNSPTLLKINGNPKRAAKSRSPESYSLKYCRLIFILLELCP